MLHTLFCQLNSKYVHVIKMSNFICVLSIATVSSKRPNVRFTSPPDWSMSFNIPWTKLSTETMSALSVGERLNSADRLAMIRVIMDSILVMCHKPLKKHLDIIAALIVAKYPKSFRDEFNGVVIGSGHDSLTLQLVNRYDYLQRPRRAPPSVQEVAENVDEGENAASSPTAAKKQKHADYGCDNWQPAVSSESTAEEVVYAEQRSAINGRMPLTVVQQKFPDLFQVGGLLTHFSCLMGGIQIHDRFTTALGDQKLLAFLLNRGLNDASIKKAMKAMDEAKVASESDLPVAPGLMWALVLHFGEHLDSIFTMVDVRYSRNL